jgi:triosephosphate isomerase
MRRKLAAGNWKMNGLVADLGELAALAARSAVRPPSACEVLICPPATLVAAAATVADGRIAIGGQTCHHAASGAHTGDVSAAMLADAGARYVILGHSERRADHGETDDLVRAKAVAARAAGLVAVVCVGETLADREAGRTLDVIETQLAGSVPDGADGASLVVAYEPVWAIGTGRVPTTEQIAEVHAVLRARLAARFGEAAQHIRLLYGGSVKASNASDIFAVADVDGALVGGASLKVADFGPIIDALDAAG